MSMINTDPKKKKEKMINKHKSFQIIKNDELATTAKKLKCLNQSHPIDEDNYTNVFNLYSKMHTTVKKPYYTKIHTK